MRWRYCFAGAELGSPARVARRLGLALALGYAPALFAANPVYVDASGGNCGGNGTVGTSCFSSLQEGIDNAGPGAATVEVLAGTYAAADISRMGSAIAAGPADLEITAFGNGAVSIEPTAGSRGIWNALTPFPGNVTLRGLTVTSPDRDAIHLEDITGDVVLDQVQAIDAGVDGVDIRNSGNVMLVDSNFDGNGNDGVEITAGGSISITRCTANGNFGSVFESALGAQLGHDGFNLEVLAGDVTIIDSEANGNGGEGFEIHPVFDDVSHIYGRIDTVTISGSHAMNNGLRSGDLPTLGEEFSVVEEILNDYPNTIMADGFQIESCDTQAPSPTGPCTIGDVNISDSSAVNNSQDGFELNVYGDVVFDTVIAEGNGNLSSGDGIDGPRTPNNSFTGRNILTRGNADDGIDVDGETFVLLEDVVADNNGKGIPQFHGFGPPGVAENFLEPS
ncbi:MAG: right-handed parallel beta-helix repeat-containing protein, partial [Pseudomonadota bacterium]